MKEFNLNKFYDLKSNNLTNKEIAKDMGISERTLYNKIKNIDVDYSSEFASSKQEIQKLKERNAQLVKETKALVKELRISNEKAGNLSLFKNNISDLGSPDWMEYSPSKRNTSVPSLLCSDEHWGEVVRSGEMNGLNEYSVDIARKRYNTVINNYLKIVNEIVPTCVDKDRMVLALGGDNISGDIHEELALTNSMTTMECVYDYVDHKVKAIKTLLNDGGFKKIFIPCVRGNHDRNTKKVHTKNMLETSYAYLIYMFLLRSFEGDDRVLFKIPSGMDCRYTVRGHRMLLTHGDCFKGFGALTGKPFKEKKAQYENQGIGFDTMICGHFHNYSNINNGEIIINGTLKGYDEYALRCGFSYQKPCQAFWLTDENGINIQLPVFAEKNELKEKKPFIVFDLE